MSQAYFVSTILPSGSSFPTSARTELPLLKEYPAFLRVIRAAEEFEIGLGGQGRAGGDGFHARKLPRQFLKPLKQGLRLSRPSLHRPRQPRRAKQKHPEDGCHPDGPGKTKVSVHTLRI